MRERHAHLGELKPVYAVLLKNALLQAGAPADEILASKEERTIGWARQARNPCLTWRKITNGVRHAPQLKRHAAKHNRICVLDGDGKRPLWAWRASTAKSRTEHDHREREIAAIHACPPNDSAAQQSGRARLRGELMRMTCGRPAATAG